MVNSLVISERDDVAVVTQPVLKGESIAYLLRNAEHTFSAAEDIPVYHKVALRDIGEGEAVCKYGSPIGVATADICRGAHVHCHNVASGAPAREVAL